VDRDVIAQKLESLRKCLLRIKDKCPTDAETLAQDPDLQDILTINLTRAVQLCVDIGTNIIAASDVPPPNTMGETFDLLAVVGAIDQQLADKLKQAVGFRNIAIHNYEAINWTIVHDIARDRLDDFNEFARRIASGL